MMYECVIMPTMPRISVSFSEPQATWLAEESKRLGVSIGELLRRIVDEHRRVRYNKEGEMEVYISRFDP